MYVERGMAPLPDIQDLRVDGGVVFINGHAFEGFIPKFIGLGQEGSIQGELMREVLCAFGLCT